MISIVIPAYNAEKTLGRCLKSLKVQTVRDFEIILVNDGSSDKTSARAEHWKQIFETDGKQFSLISQANAGANSARNRGAREAHGKYIIFLDADIVADPRMLEKMMHTLEEHAEDSYVYSAFKFGWKTFKLRSFDAERLRRMPYIHTSSLIRRADFPGFDERLKRFQDWDLWLTMLEQGKAGVFIPEMLFKIINTGGTMSTWLPSFFHKIPWPIFGYTPPSVRRYQEAMEIIKTKHHLKNDEYQMTNIK